MKKRWNPTPMRVIQLRRDNSKRKKNRSLKEAGKTIELKLKKTRKMSKKTYSTISLTTSEKLSSKIRKNRIKSRLSKKAILKDR